MQGEDGEAAGCVFQVLHPRCIVLCLQLPAAVNQIAAAPVADLSSQTSEKQRLDHYPLRAQQKLWAEQSVRLGWGSPVAIDSSLPPAGCCAPTWARVIWVLGCSGAVHAPASWSALRNPSDVHEAAAPSSWCGKGLLPSSCWPLAVSSWDGASVCGEGIWA